MTKFQFIHQTTLSEINIMEKYVNYISFGPIGSLLFLFININRYT